MAGPRSGAPARGTAAALIRVATAEDHPVFREGLRKALSMGPDLQLVGEASDGEQALAMVAIEKPDVLVLDLTMPRCDGFGVLQQLPRVAPSTRALVLTGHLEREFEVNAVAAGARGFLHKDSSVESILRAVRAVAAGEIWASRTATSTVLRASAPAAEPMDALTPREREILAFLGRGMMNREIAVKTSLSEKTIASHVASLIAKLGLRGRVEAAMLARKYGHLDTGGGGTDR
jgi:DNA-binding NarL/FixJ family response regulator